MATISQRQERFRQRRLADGSKREAFWLDAAAQDALARLRSIHTGLTRDQLVGISLIALLEHNRPLDDNSAKPLLEHNKPLATNRPLEHNKVLATNADMPADRAELAGIARDWRGQGVTLDVIAKRLNERGWTPSAIPAKRTTAETWTGKTVSQLLNRDCKADE